MFHSTEFVMNADTFVIVRDLCEEPIESQTQVSRWIESCHADMYQRSLSELWSNLPDYLV